MGFIDSFKRLEKLCGEIYDTSHGVSAYIDEMDNIYDGLSYVIGWNEDLKMLKHCRHARNKIAHEPGCTEKNTCESGDEEWLLAFYSRMLDGRDPLATYRKAKMAQKQAEKKAKSQAEKQTQKTVNKTQKQTIEQRPKQTEKQTPKQISKPTQKQTQTRKTPSLNKNNPPASKVDDEALKDGCLTCVIIAVVAFVLMLIGYFW